MNAAAGRVGTERTTHALPLHRARETHSMSSRIAYATVAAGVLAGTVTFAQNGTPINPHSNNALTLAVYGDAPYGVSPTDDSETQLTRGFIASVNADPKVDLVVHVGDIHSGKQYCTEGYDRTIADLWSAFKNPLIYTPGDNEWTDCHKAAQGGHVVDRDTGLPVGYADGNPVANLALVRQIFFSTPGYALGSRKKQVLTQAFMSDPRFPTDANYVENVMWEQSKVLFVTLNVPGGSNNDADNWYGAARTQPQTDEIAQRTQADLHWLAAAFDQAQQDGVEAVVVILQADMWDLDGKVASHIANYEPFIASMASHALSLAKPVLLFNGDSHQYRSDNPLKSGQACWFESGVGAATIPCGDPALAGAITPDAYVNHSGYNVSNFHRIVVHGSTTPLEWLRLTITPGTNASEADVIKGTAFGPFHWERVIPQE
jgi:hypothetical protein